MVTVSGLHRIVAIETTGRQGSVALAVGDELLSMACFGAQLRHATELMPTIDRLCAACNWPPHTIEEVYVSAGPGSFTGCRIGVTVAKALALAVDAQLIRVPTTDVLARNALDSHTPPRHMVVLLDAQRRQVYSARFELCGNGYVSQGEVQAGDPRVLLTDVPRPCAVLGEGIAYHRRTVEEMDLEILPEALWIPRAENVLRIGRQLAFGGGYVAAGDLVPIYIRLPEAEEKWQMRHGRAFT